MCRALPLREEANQFDIIVRYNVHVYCSLKLWSRRSWSFPKLFKQMKTNLFLSALRLLFSSLLSRRVSSLIYTKSATRRFRFGGSAVSIIAVFFSPTKFYFTSECLLNVFSAQHDNGRIFSKRYVRSETEGKFKLKNLNEVVLWCSREAMIFV